MVRHGSTLFRVFPNFWCGLWPGYPAAAAGRRPFVPRKHDGSVASRVAVGHGREAPGLPLDATPPECYPPGPRGRERQKPPEGRPARPPGWRRRGGPRRRRAARRAREGGPRRGAGRGAAPGRRPARPTRGRPPPGEALGPRHPDPVTEPTARRARRRPGTDAPQGGPPGGPPWPRRRAQAASPKGRPAPRGRGWAPAAGGALRAAAAAPKERRTGERAGSPGNRPGRRARDGAGAGRAGAGGANAEHTADAPPVGGATDPATARADARRRGP